MKPLGNNNGGYFGEPIDAPTVMVQIDAVAKAKNWHSESFQLEPGFSLQAYTRRSQDPKNAVYISSGIHGDEPAGPLAILSLLEQDQWPAGMDLFLCPFLNPSGFPLNTRENSNKLDQNRDYRHLKSLEVRTHTEWLKKQPLFDLALCLHEDWEAKGFYLYELNPDNRKSLASSMLRAVESICPIDFSEQIDDWEAASGLIRPKVAPDERELWAEAVFLIVNKTRQSYTLETPSDFSLEVRMKAHNAAVIAALRELS